MLSLRTAVLSLLLLAACAADPVPPEDSAAPGLSAEPVSFDWLAGREVHEPRLVVDREGTLLIVWRQKVEEGSDVFVARRRADGRFGEPVHVNDEAGTVESYPHDEMRPAVAAGPDGRLAVAWSDSRGQVRAAESRDGGGTFAPSFRLEQVEEPSYRGFPELVYDDDGVLHGVWIDSRFAEGMAEEPADLFYARIAEGEVAERNLTADQEPTVCGCCRPALEIADGMPRMVFRNATSDGYRDIFFVRGTFDAGFSPPRRVGHPLWKLQGCPMSGPAALDDSVVWPDGSSGRKRLMTAGYDGAEAVPLFAPGGDAEWSPRLSPRRVSTGDGSAPLLLLPGRPGSRIVARRDGRWVPVAEDLPPWASSAHYREGVLLLIGAVDGALESREERIEL